MDRVLIFASAFLRSMGLGMVAVLLAIYLIQLDFTKTEVGFVLSAGLAGAAVGNLVATFLGDRFGRKKVLIAYALLTAAGGVAVCFAPTLFALLGAAFCGMLNARGKDRGAALILESAILPSVSTPETRTKTFAHYSILQDVGLALGGLVAGLPTLLTTFWDVPLLIGLQASFGLYAGCMLISGVLYSRLSKNVEVSDVKTTTRFSPEGKTIVTKISSLFAIDSLASGFLTSALIAYYLYERFDMSLHALGFLFFIARCLNACSYFGAVWLSKKIGLIRTMVFSHSPSHLLAIALAFAPTFPVAATLFLLRELLVDMDIPTRQSYVMAVVKPEERTKAAGITQIVRMAGWAIAPLFAGVVMHQISSVAPLIIGAGMKMVYDGLIYWTFRKVRPPEELMKSSSAIPN